MSNAFSPSIVAVSLYCVSIDIDYDWARVGVVRCSDCPAFAKAFVLFVFRLPPQRGGFENNVALEAFSVVSVFDISLNACLSISFNTTKRRMALNRLRTPYDL